MTCVRFQRAMAATLSLSLVALLAAPAAWASEPSSFSGRVMAGDGVTPRSGVRVTLVERPGQRTFRSTPTTGDGAFRIDDAAAGTYDVVVEADEGAFVLQQPLALKPGANAPLALNLQRTSGAGPSFQTTGTPTTAGQPSRWPPFAKWIVVGVIAAAALFVINDVTGDEDEGPASPS